MDKDIQNSIDEWVKIINNIRFMKKTVTIGITWKTIELSLLALRQMADKELEQEVRNTDGELL